MKNVVLWDIKTQFVLHRKHIMSPLESNRLMLCKISGCHGGGYEGCRLLGRSAVALVRTDVSEKRSVSADS
jgi:hypothetical protein